jgi:hypothetical protein
MALTAQQKAAKAYQQQLAKELFDYEIDKLNTPEGIEEFPQEVRQGLAHAAQLRYDRSLVEIEARFKTRRRKIEKPSMGIYSEGSLRTEDILEGIESLLPLRIVADIRRELRKEDEGIASQILNEDAWSYIENRLPDYTYFGSHPGDGACFGVWADIESVEESARYDEGVIKVDDLSEIPHGYTGYVMHVNDHGNVSFYYRSKRKLRNIWAVV